MTLLDPWHILLNFRIGFSLLQGSFIGRYMVFHGIYTSIWETIDIFIVLRFPGKYMIQLSIELCMTFTNKRKKFLLEVFTFKDTHTWLTSECYFEGFLLSCIFCLLLANLQLILTLIFIQQPWQSLNYNRIYKHKFGIILFSSSHAFLFLCLLQLLAHPVHAMLLPQWGLWTCCSLCLECFSFSFT